eukprot:TRINITY_DN14763_c0_g1_i4.p1 TRINITY_DN14763_c0_g1~~TRINITY_DN14763_c0_g1_i4.p1  ORF type:complete len:253 (-),score=51.44 TRINITY_DN14763_c0_g1_i4:53-811(-)
MCIRDREINSLENCGALIYVLDVSTEPYSEALKYLSQTIIFMQQTNPKIYYHVFLHKIDADNLALEEKKNDVLNNIKEAISEELELNGHKSINISYHLTTIYDCSLIECFSKVTHKVIAQQPYLQTLLDSLLTNCKMEKVFLFEVVSKLYIATDQQPIEITNFAICTEMIDVFIDISYIYGQSQIPLAYDDQAQAIIKLTDGTVLILKEVEKYLALICIIKEADYDRPFLIDYNIEVFKEGLKQLFSQQKNK